MKASSNDTITAIATPVGEGGIAVLRISGPDAIPLAAKGFKGRVDLATAATHTAHVGKFYNPNGEILDEVVAVVFREPTSYTGENVVEISCHGGILVPRTILHALLEYGARLAEPGEFTKRAFLNSRIDLSQAEAVADLIHAGSERSQRSSLRQLQGELGQRIGNLREGLIRAVGLLELELDFAEEGLEFADKSKVADQIRDAVGSIQGLLQSYHTGRLYRDGVKVVLAGMPNVGKSSLLNALLKEQRAIVTDVPGTTRDTIEESLSINGLAFRIVDTAGLRDAVDRAEQEGVKRSEDQINSSDLLVLVIDGSKPLGAEELKLAERLAKDLRGRASTIVAFNKIDLAPGTNGALEQRVSTIQPKAVVKVSALTGEGLEGLREALVQSALAGQHATSENSVTVTNARHYQVLAQSAKSLDLALKSLETGAGGEFVTPDIRAALDSLGEITGAVTTDDILDEIFSKFCIGK
ncbi:MAG: tRNA uridine-5-carboxymethylaminomethyl(34) synthesis GTPase MnmE [Bacteroidota bacterium]